MFYIKVKDQGETKYKVVSKCQSETVAREYVRAYKVYHNPIDIYYTINPPREEVEE